jgi:hypothetical protein
MRALIFPVIASEANQSSLSAQLDCFVALLLATTTDRLRRAWIGL